MDIISNQERKCIDCSMILIPGDNINENVYKRGRKVCRPCDTKARKEKRNKTNELCPTSEYARWKRVERLVGDCSSRTREGRVKLINDSSSVLMQHLREIYPVLPVVCPIYEDIDLISFYYVLRHQPHITEEELSIALKKYEPYHKGSNLD